MQFSDMPAPHSSEGRITLPWLIARHMDRIFRGLEAPFLVNGVDGDEWRSTLSYLIFGLWLACKGIMDKGAKDGEKEDQISLWARMKKKDLSPKDIDLTDWLEEMGRIMNHKKVLEIMADRELPTEDLDDQLVAFANRWGVALKMPKKDEESENGSKPREIQSPPDLLGVV